MLVPAQLVGLNIFINSQCLTFTFLDSAYAITSTWGVLLASRLIVCHSFAVLSLHAGLRPSLSFTCR